jgi:hypothetical protein
MAHSLLQEREFGRSNDSLHPASLLNALLQRRYKAPAIGKIDPQLWKLG